MGNNVVGICWPQLACVESQAAGGKPEGGCCGQQHELNLQKRGKQCLQLLWSSGAVSWETLSSLVNEWRVLMKMQSQAQ